MSWAPVTARVAQGAILGVLFFLIYIELIKDISLTIKPFTDDTLVVTILIIPNDNVPEHELDSDLQNISTLGY